MPNPYVNKVEVNGTPIIDLTSDTVTAATLAAGERAHDASGAPIIGRLEAVTAVPITITQDGTYTAPSGTAYSPVTVNTGGDDPEPTWPTDDKTHLWITVEDASKDVQIRHHQYSAYGVQIDWGDGDVETYSGSGTSAYTRSHTYAATGNYEIIISNASADSGGFDFNASSGVNILGSITGTNAYKQRLLRRAYIAGTKSSTLPNYLFHMMICLEAVCIASKISTLGQFDFQYCLSLKHVRLSNSLINTIPMYSFRYCVSLEKITLPHRVDSVGTYAFGDCHSLKTVVCSGTAPGELAAYAFANCYALNDFGQYGLWYARPVGNYVFNNCISLMDSEGCLTIPRSWTTIPANTFTGNHIVKKIVISNTITTIQANAFGSMAASDVYIYATTPPTVENTNAFSKWNTGLVRTFHVPAGTLSAYQANTNWNTLFSSTGNSVVEMPA